MHVDDTEVHRLIFSYPLFSSLSKEEIDQLVLLAFEESYGPHQIIVHQGEIVDAFYLISKGEIEVSKKEQDNETLIPLLVLKQGEAIGLDPQGIFSQTGERKATLTAISDVSLIGWKLEDFHQFLQTHPQFKSSLLQTSGLMLRMNFIKQVDPFANLPIDRISRLANQIEELSIPNGTILFRQGELGDRSYLLYSGQVELLRVKENGEEERITTMEPPALFGEIALLANTQRNATARMIEEGKLLVIKREPLQELMKYQATSESIMSLIADRCRPVRKQGIEIFQIESKDHQVSVILKDGEFGRYFKISREGLLLWRLLDGTRTLQNIVIELAKRSQLFSAEGIITTLFNLADAGFVLLPEVETPTKPELLEKRSFFEKVKMGVFKMAHLSVVFKKVDHKFTTAYQWVQFLFYEYGLVALSALIVSGLIGFFVHFSEAVTAIQTTHHLVAILISLFFANLLSVVLHELGHGMAVKYFHRDVNLAGMKVIWFGLGFVAFVDTSDMWLSDKRSRIIVSFAGPYVDMLMAGIASLLALLIPQQEIALFSWLFALTLYYSVYKNLNPLIEGDGYSILNEELEDPYLINSAYTWLENAKLKEMVTPAAWQKNRPGLIYWAVSLLFLVIGLMIAIAFSYLLRSIVSTLFGLSTLHLYWLLPALVLLKFILTIRGKKIA
jgi:CRP-like cAMP-binding protein